VSYIGSSVNITNRWRIHLSELRRGTHHSPYLQHCYNKYGEESLKFEVLAILNEYNETILRTLEYVYIEQFHPKFNCATPEMHECSEEWRNKISKSTKLLYQNGYKNPRLDCGKKYKVYDYLGNSHLQNVSIKKAADYVGAKDYHYFNTVLKNNDGFVLWKTGLFIIMDIDKTKEDLLSFYRKIKTKRILMYDSKGNIYNKGRTNTYKVKKLKERLAQSQNFILEENGIVYSYPCLQSNAVL
jgi:hypothetical protein